MPAFLPACLIISPQEEYQDGDVFGNDEDQMVEIEKRGSFLVAFRGFVFPALRVAFRIGLPCMGLKRRGLASISR